MNEKILDVVRAFSPEQRLSLIAHLIYHLSEIARGEYPPPADQHIDGYRQLRAFNEMSHELAHQLLAAIGQGQAMPLEQALTEVLPHDARFADCEKHLDWAIAKAMSYVKSGR